MASYFDVVFDGPPGPEAGRFVECENEHGRSISIGQWVHRPDGYWALRIPCSKAPSCANCPASDVMPYLGTACETSCGRQP